MSFFLPQQTNLYGLNFTFQNGRESPPSMLNLHTTCKLQYCIVFVSILMTINIYINLLGLNRCLVCSVHGNMQECKSVIQKPLPDSGSVDLFEVLVEF